MQSNSNFRNTKIVAAIFFMLTSSTALATYGELLATFGDTGVVSTDFGSLNESANRAYATILMDGDLYLAGTADNGANFDFAIAKYNAATGALDPDFDTDGLVLTPIGSAVDSANAMTGDEASLYLAGYTYNGANYDFAIAKYNATTGALDTDFDTDGVVTLALGSSDDLASAIAIADTSLYVSGYTYNGANYDFAIAKYNATTGALDTTFATDGAVTLAIGSSDDYLTAITLDGNSLYVAGYTFNGTNDDFAIVKYDASTGDLDASFGVAGVVTVDIDSSYDTARAMTSDGTSLYVAGYTNEGLNYDFAIAKFDMSTGDLVTSFDADGILTTDVSLTDDFAYAISRDDTSLYVAGSSGDFGFFSDDFAIAKYDAATGALDLAFDDDGFQNFSLTEIEGDDKVQGIALSNSVIYLAGYCEDSFENGDVNFCVMALDNTDADADGFGVEEGDCDDNNELVYPLATELCDGIDNDCDAETDETFVTLGEVCSVGEGACENSGVFVCNGDQDDVECDAIAGDPSDEVCDGIDNDCDAETDETFVTLGEVCSVGEGTCENSGVFVCNGDQDDVECDAIAGDPSDEVCDGIDNDCDDEIDETFATLGEACSAGDGACENLGVIVCNSGEDGVECGAIASDPSDEVCDDNIDNDCDDRVDANDSDCENTAGDDDDDGDEEIATANGCQLADTQVPAGSALFYVLLTAGVLLAVRCRQAVQ